MSAMQLSIPCSSACRNNQTGLLFSTAKYRMIYSINRWSQAKNDFCSFEAKSGDEPIHFCKIKSTMKQCLIVYPIIAVEKTASTIKKV